MHNAFVCSGACDGMKTALNEKFGHPIRSDPIHPSIRSKIVPPHTLDGELSNMNQNWTEIIASVMLYPMFVLKRRFKTNERFSVTHIVKDDLNKPSNSVFWRFLLFLSL